MAVQDVRIAPTFSGRQLFRDAARGSLPGGTLAAAFAMSFYKVGEKGYLVQPGGTQLPKDPNDSGLGYSTRTDLEATDLIGGTTGNRTFQKSLAPTSVKTVAGINVPPAVAGERRQLSTAGTVNPGGIVVVIGDTVEYDGASWRPGLVAAGNFTILAACIMLIGEANVTPDLQLFELGIFVPMIVGYSAGPIMLGYGSFPKTPKNNLVEHTLNVRITY